MKTSHLSLFRTSPGRFHVFFRLGQFRTQFARHRSLLIQLFWKSENIWGKLATPQPKEIACAIRRGQRRNEKCSPSLMLFHKLRISSFRLFNLITLIISLITLINSPLNRVISADNWWMVGGVCCNSGWLLNSPQPLASTPDKWISCSSDWELSVF